MSRNLPSTPLATIEWLEARLDAWSIDPTGIGVTPAQIAELTTRLDEARAVHLEAQELRAQSKGKTTEFYGKADHVHTLAAGMIQNMKAFASTTSEPASVYAQANLSQTAGQSTVAPPSQPTSFRFTLLADGSVKLMWEAIGPTGTIYNITRQLSGETDFIFIGRGDGTTKSFIDTALPSGTAHASYRIEGIRGALVGPMSGTYSIYFGSVGSAASTSGSGAKEATSAQVA